MNSDLHLVRLVLDRRELIRIAARHHLPRELDEGYLLHAGLAQLFATSAEPAQVPLHTFATDDTLPSAAEHPELVFLLGYSDFDEGALIARMGASRGQLVHQCASRVVPTLALGTRASFRVRACPVVRTKRPGEHGPRRDAKGRTRAREVDAWLAHRLATWQPEPPDRNGRPFEKGGEEWTEREQIYGAWLTRELAREDACVLEQGAKLDRFQRLAVHRRGAPKAERRGVPQRPDAILDGTLRVTDADAFRALLRRGVGRHRSFGFGMLLLRRAE